MDLGTLLTGGGMTLLGVVIGKISDARTAKQKTKTDAELSRESQLWSEVHDLRDRLETSDKDRVAQETACEARIDALISRHDRDVSTLMTQIKALEEINKHLQLQIDLLVKNHVEIKIPVEILPS